MLVEEEERLPPALQRDGGRQVVMGRRERATGYRRSEDGRALEADCRGRRGVREGGEWWFWHEPTQSLLPVGGGGI